jgi:hypothetical protein
MSNSNSGVPRVSPWQSLIKAIDDLVAFVRERHGKRLLRGGPEHQEMGRLDTRIGGLCLAKGLPMPYVRTAAGGGSGFTRLPCDYVRDVQGVPGLEEIAHQSVGPGLVIIYFAPTWQRAMAALRIAAQARQEAEEEPPIQVVSGGFILAGRVRQALTGKPLDILRELLFASNFCRSREELRDAVWPDDGPTFPEQAVSDNVCKLREALRAALKALGVANPRDPVPSSGRGKDAAYRLDLTDIPAE